MQYKSYLVTGAQKDREEITKKLLINYKLNPAKSSQDMEIIEAPNAQITVKQIQKIKKSAYLKPYSTVKAIIIKDAQKLNTISQNALLKILEEPPENLLIILEAQNNKQFLPTVLSRLSQINTKPAHETDQAVFPAEIEGRLQALSQIKDPLAWIDSEIVKRYQTSAKNPQILEKQQKNIETLAAGKKMIASNVSTQFVLANLALTLDD